MSVLWKGDLDSWESAIWELYFRAILYLTGGQPSMLPHLLEKKYREEISKRSLEYYEKLM